MTTTAPPQLERRCADLVRVALRDRLGRAPRLVVLGLSRDDHPKATVVAFGPEGRTPRLVAKVALAPGAVRAVLAEAAALREVARLDPGRVGGTVPRLVDVRREGDEAVLVTSAVPGVPMSVDYHRWRHTARPTTVRDDLDAATGWLGRLRLLRPATPPTRDASGPDVPSMLRARWPGDAVAERTAEAAADLGVVLALPAGVPTAVVHGDFWCGNVLRTGGRVTGVVDWEHAAFGGDPLRDVTRFVLAYVLYLDRHTRPGRAVAGHPGLVAGPWGEPVRHALGRGGWLPEVVERTLGAQLVAGGRDPRHWREALALALAEVAATSDHDGFAREHLLLAAEVLRCR